MTNFMQTGAHAFGGSFPGFEAFGVGQGFFAAAENLCLDVGVEVVRAGQFFLVFVEPVGKTAAFLGIEFQQRLFKLFHAHGR